MTINHNRHIETTKPHTGRPNLDYDNCTLYSTRL